MSYPSKAKIGLFLLYIFTHRHWSLEYCGRLAAATNKIHCLILKTLLLLFLDFLKLPSVFFYFIFFCKPRSLFCKEVYSQLQSLVLTIQRYSDFAIKKFCILIAICYFSIFLRHGVPDFSQDFLWEYRTSSVLGSTPRGSQHSRFKQFGTLNKHCSGSIAVVLTWLNSFNYLQKIESFLLRMSQTHKLDSNLNLEWLSVSSNKLGDWR